METRERERFADAVAFALEVHAAQTRKGTRIPYVSHLLQVAGLVLEHGGDAEQAIAAVLHDAIEDCDGVDAAMLRGRFGEDVTRIVVQCSDVLPDERPDAKSPWIERKRRYLAQLSRADARTQLVAACDKLHNLRSLLGDLRAEGPATLERFTATPEQTRGYYEAVHDALARDLPDRLRHELEALLVELRGFVRTSAFERHADP